MSEYRIDKATRYAEAAEDHLELGNPEHAVAAALLAMFHVERQRAGLPPDPTPAAKPPLMLTARTIDGRTWVEFDGTLQRFLIDNAAEAAGVMTVPGSVVQAAADDLFDDQVDTLGNEIWEAMQALADPDNDGPPSAADLAHYIVQQREAAKRPARHAGCHWPPDVPCPVSWKDGPTRDDEHRCDFGQNHLADHHCPCGATSPR